MYELLYAGLWETASKESQAIYPVEEKDVLTANFKQAMLHTGSKWRWLLANLTRSWVSPGGRGGPVPGAACGRGGGPGAHCMSRAVETWLGLGSTAGRAACLLLLSGLALLVAS